MSSLDLTKFIYLSNESQSVEHLYGLLEQALYDLCGYDRVIFSLMTDHSSLGLKAGHGIMRNYPDDWMKHYIEKGYEYIDPVRRFGFRNYGPFIWDDLPLVMALTPQQTTCMHECRDAGFNEGAALAIRGLLGEMGGVGVASSAKGKPASAAESKYKLSLLNAIAHQFYVVFCSLHKKIPVNTNIDVVLTNKEIDVIRQMALAKNDGCIAYNLGMSRHAVDYHVRNILKKLNAPNRMYAVMKAINSGFLALDDAAFIRKSTR